MNKILFLFLALFLSLGAHASSVRVGDFGLIDHRGDFHQLTRYADKKAVVLYVYANSCETSQSATSVLQSLRDKYQNQPVAFLMLNAHPDDTRESVLAQTSKTGTDIPVLMDVSQLVAESLDIIGTGEVLVINPRRMELLYRGAVNQELSTASVSSENPDYLDEVLSAVLADEPVRADMRFARGNALAMENLQESHNRDISYASDVVPILEKRCVSCHKENGVAPWAMSSYEMVRGWSAMMRETLLTRRMPPGQIDYQDVDKFVDVHYITDEEMTTLVHWIDRGAPNQDAIDPLLDIEPRTSEWALGEPDLIVEFPTQEIPASGVVDYKFIPVDIGLEEDKWVRAYEFSIGDKLALHHVVAYTQDRKQQKQNPSGGGSRTNFGGYAPGREHMVFDSNSGVLLKKDMRFMVQFHYTTTGRVVTDKTRLGLYFRDTPPLRNLSRTAVMSGDFVIPPGVADYPVSATAVLPKDVYLYGLAPHMHYRGKRIRFTANLPDGSSESLLSIPNFQHNWQMNYRLRAPKFLPAGTVIVADGAFDNSPLNPLNPDPSQEVKWGDQVWDEMFIAWMRISELE
jgi:thiol-disulfide isomerase/thioredoxin